MAFWLGSFWFSINILNAVYSVCHRERWPHTRTTQCNIADITSTIYYPAWYLVYLCNEIWDIIHNFVGSWYCFFFGIIFKCVYIHIKITFLTWKSGDEKMLREYVHESTNRHKCYCCSLRWLQTFFWWAGCN